MAQDAIRIASYNTHGGVGRDGHFVPKRIADVLQELDADIIALQEVENRATGFDMLAYLKGETGFEAIAGPTLLRRGADYGNGLLTRFKVLSVQRINLCVERCEPRGAIDVELDCGGTPMRVLATHLGLRPHERREQIKSLLRKMEVHATRLARVASDHLPLTAELDLHCGTRVQQHEAFGSQRSSAW